MSKKLYYINPSNMNKDEIISELSNHKEIKFISLSAVDLGNNHTDEKIPIRYLLEDFDNFISTGIQTDGSSVFLPEIANINNAKVDLIPDISVRWFVDYNFNHIDEETNSFVGTLVIPAFLRHNGEFVCSRSILKKAVKNFKSEILDLLNSNENLRQNLGVDKSEKFEKISITTATELEFWVKTPDASPNIMSLSTSQTLKEHYWKRTVGAVRTAMEKTLIALDDFGLNAEMGHKEVGGITAKLKKANDYSYVMEQLEVDWKYDEAIQTADNEIFVKDIVEDIFVREGLQVTFKAKPIEGVAGSGEHHHIGLSAKLSSGKIINLLGPFDKKTDFLSIIGYSSLMGILKNYEVINPFVSSTNDAFRRLVPGFEAPVSIVTSLGKSFEKPARNRTVLIDLISDENNKLATRFELRSPNPGSNSFLLLAATLQSMLDGVLYAVKNEKTSSDLLNELTKKYGEDAQYLEKNREYVTTLNIFDELDEETRNKLYAKPPRTVYDVIKNMKACDVKLAQLKRNDVFTDKIVSSYIATIFDQWINQLQYRILLDAKRNIKKYKRIHEKNNEGMIDPYVKNLWNNVSEKKKLLLNSYGEDSLLFEIELAIANKDYEKVNDLQVKIVDILSDIDLAYTKYELSLY